MGPAAIPVHPESVEGDPRTLRWIFPVATLDFVGVPSSVPPSLQKLLDDGVVTRLSVEPAALRATLAAELSWHEHGDRARMAIQAALASPDEWQAPTGANSDDVLRLVVQEVIDGEVGDYIRSHGGQVELIGVKDSDVEIELSGACSHCPASGFTLTTRVEAAIRASYPGLRRLVSKQDPGVGSASRLFRLFTPRDS